MIEKIKSNEYLRRIDNMSVAERQDYEARVGEWLKNQAPLLTAKVGDDGARFQNAVQFSAVWNVAECKAWMDGIRLLSALTQQNDTWLPDMIYTKAAKRCIERIVTILSTVGHHQVEQTATVRHEQSTRPAGPSRPLQTPSDQPKPERPTPSDQSKPVRPTHFDQYAHLLPEKTQERIAKYGPLMRELDDLREKARLLMDAKDASSSEREAVAKRIVAIDKQIGSIRREADAEWEKLAESGRVVVDDLGMAHLTDKGKDGDDDKADGDDSGDEGDGEDSKSLDSVQKARRRELRKWLTDTRRGNGDTREAHVAKWLENFKEYLTLEPEEKAMTDQKILEAMEHYGIKK